MKIQDTWEIELIGDTTYGLGYKESEELAEKLENALCKCNNPIENSKALCGAILDCHLHDWRQGKKIVDCCPNCKNVCPNCNLGGGACTCCDCSE